MTNSDEILLYRYFLTWFVRSTKLLHPRKPKPRGKVAGTDVTTVSPAAVRFCENNQTMEGKTF